MFVRSAEHRAAARDADRAAARASIRLGHRHAPPATASPPSACIIRDSIDAVIQTRHGPAARRRSTRNVQAAFRSTCRRRCRARSSAITAFAVDQAGRIGYAVPASKGSVRKATSPPRSSTRRSSSTATRTRCPQQGTIGDIAVDAARGNVFLSNTDVQPLEVWQHGAAKALRSRTASPSARCPWGMFISNNPDTLLVANSGGTNISRVDLDRLHDAEIAQRIRDARHAASTRSPTYAITCERMRTLRQDHDALSDPDRSATRIARSTSRSRRAARIFYSTRPTADRARRHDSLARSDAAVPDPRQIWQYGIVHEGHGEQDATRSFNVDSIAIGATLPASTDVRHAVHLGSPVRPERPARSRSPTPIPLQRRLARSASPAAATRKLDAAARHQRRWRSPTRPSSRPAAIATGSRSAKATRPAPAASSWCGLGRRGAELLLAARHDHATSRTTRRSRSSDSRSTARATRSRRTASQSYFASVDDPFHLRLQGKYDSFDNGGGITFHPQRGRHRAGDAQRTRVRGVGNRSVEIVDIAYYINRGTLPLKNPIYGPLRAALPDAGRSRQTSS